MNLIKQTISDFMNSNGLISINIYDNDVYYNLVANYNMHLTDTFFVTIKHTQISKDLWREPLTINSLDLFFNKYLNKTALIVFEIKNNVDFENPIIAKNYCKYSDNVVKNIEFVKDWKIWGLNALPLDRYIIVDKMSTQDIQEVKELFDKENDLDKKLREFIYLLNKSRKNEDKR